MTRDELQAAIEEAGGLFTQAGLARRWQVTPSWASEAVHRPTFPEPLYIDEDRPVWSGKEVDAWRSTLRKSGRRRAT